jgi:hypothetical protein
MVLTMALAFSISIPWTIFARCRTVPDAAGSIFW